MRHSRFKIMSAMLLMPALGCGATENVHRPAAPPAAPAEAAPTKAEPDRSPVEAPPGLVALGRVRTPAKLADEAFEWAELPLDWRGILASQGGGVAQALNLDAPIEFAATLGAGDDRGDPELHAVISAGLNSLDQAVAALRAAGIELEEQKPGVYRILGNDDAACAVAVAVGSSPARVVCGDEGGLGELLPFATRGLPSAEIGDAELSAKVLAEPVRKRFSTELGRMRQAVVPWLLREFSRDSSSFDRALADALQGGANELFSALDHAEALTFEGKLDESRQTFSFEAALVMQASDSVFSRTVTDLAARAAAPSPQFWALPSDVHTAGWSDYGGTAATQAVREVGNALLQGLLEQQGVEPAAIRGVPLATDLVLGPRAPMLSITGRALASQAGSKGSSQWFGYGVARPLKDVERGLDAAVAIAKSPALHRSSPAWTFKARKQRRSLVGVKGESIEYRLELPEALANLISSDGDPGVPTNPTQRAGDRARSSHQGAAKAKTKAWVIVIHQSGEQTWIVGAEDRAGADWALRQIVNGVPETLDGQAGLDSLKASRGFCAGAMTLEGILESLREEGVLGTGSASPHSATQNSASQRAAKDAVWLPFTCSATQNGTRIRLGMGFELQRAFFAAATKEALASLGGLFGR